MKNGPETFSFGTDFHGNLKNIDEFLRQSADRNIDHIVFGGDIAPKKMAMKLTDGKAFKLSFFLSSIQDGFKKSEYGDPDDLREEGHMLFNTGMSVEKLEMLVSIYEKLTRFGYNNGDQLDMTIEEILFLEANIDTLLVDFLINDPSGQRIFAMYKRDISAMYPSFSLLTPKKLASIFVDMAKSHFIYKHAYKHDQIKLLLCGKTKVSDSKLKSRMSRMMNGTAIVGSKGFGPLVNSMKNNVKAFPWIEWQKVQRDLHMHAIDGQRLFAEDFFRRISEFRQSFRVSVTAILGNDDIAELAGDFDRADREGVLNHATNRVVRAAPDLQVVGYSHVPAVHAVGYREWFKSEGEIESDLRDIFKGVEVGVGRVIGDIHCSPRGTALSQVRIEGDPETDYGSEGVRNFLMDSGLKVVLSGHTHESWRITGEVRDIIGDTHVYNPGASEYRGRYLFGTLDDPDDYEVVDGDKV